MSLCGRAQSTSDDTHATMRIRAGILEGRRAEVIVSRHSFNVVVVVVMVVVVVVVVVFLTPKRQHEEFICFFFFLSPALHCRVLALRFSVSLDMYVISLCTSCGQH